MSNEIPESDILTILYKKPQTFHSYIMRFEPEFFDERLRNFFKIFKTHYARFKEAPSVNVFKLEAETDADFVACSQIINKIEDNFEKMNGYTHDYIMGKIDVFTKRSFIKKSLIKGLDLYDEKDYGKVLEVFSKAHEAIIDCDMGIEYHDDDFFTDRYSKENFGNVIKTGWKQFDDEFKGWHKKALHVIAGPANSGKTMYLVNAAANKLVNSVEPEGTKILYITLEIDKDQLGRRIDTCICGIPTKDIAEKKTQQVKELLNASHDLAKNRLILKEMQGYKTTPADIDSFICNLSMSSKDEYKPDLVLIDYLGLISPTHASKNSNTYERGLMVAVELRALAQKYDIPFVVAAQTNRSSFTDSVGMDTISDSIGIVQTCDLLITINRNEQMDEDGTVKLYIAKSRFSRNGNSHIFKVDYDIQRVEDILGNGSVVDEGL